MEVHQLHRIALFLHPKLKSLKLLQDDSLKVSSHNIPTAIGMKLVKDLETPARVEVLCRISADRVQR